MRQTQMDGLFGPTSSWVTKTDSLEGGVVGLGVELILGSTEVSSELVSSELTAVVSATVSTEAAAVRAELAALQIVSGSPLVWGWSGLPS